MKIDYSQVEKNLNKLMKKTLGAAEKGLRVAGFKLMEDSKKKAPQAPFDRGHLWSQFIMDKPQFKINNISLRVGASTPYAARWHETTDAINWTTTKGASKPGPKYIISKIFAYGKDYIQLQYEVIRKEIKKI